MSKNNLQTLLEKLRALDEKATPGPLTIHRYDWEHGEINYQIETDDLTREDSVFASVLNKKVNAEFITEVRSALPLLLEIIEKQRNALSYQYKWMASEETEDGIYCQNSNDFEIHRNCLRHYICECDEIAARIK